MLVGCVSFLYLSLFSLNGFTTGGPIPKVTPKPSSVACAAVARRRGVRG